MPSPLARITIVGALFLLIAGCQSNPTIASLFARHRPAPANDNAPTERLQNESSFVLEQGMVVYWDAQPARMEPGQAAQRHRRHWTGWQFSLGPLWHLQDRGHFHRPSPKALEQHLAAYMPTPTVRLSMTATPDVMEVAWRPVQPAVGRTVTSSRVSEGHGGEDMANGPQGVETVIWRR